MPERRLLISTPAAAGPRRHPRRQGRHCRLLVLPAFALALVSLAYLSFSSLPNLPFHAKHHDMASIKDVKERMDRRQTLDAKVKANLSMTKVELEPFKRRKKSRKHFPGNCAGTTGRCISQPQSFIIVNSLTSMLELRTYPEFATKQHQRQRKRRSPKPQARVGN